jgi:hypothetical protein
MDVAHLALCEKVLGERAPQPVSPAGHEHGVPLVAVLEAPSACIIAQVPNTVFCMPSSLHRFFSRERKRKKCSDGAPVRFFRAALSGVWDLPCNDSFLLTPILVLSQLRLCLRGPVVCVVELAARISGRCRRCQQRAKCGIELH